MAQSSLAELTSAAHGVIRVRTSRAEEFRDALVARGADAQLIGPDRLEVAGATGEEVGTTVTTVTGFSMLLAAVLGVIVASGEFRHNTVTLTYLGTPDRVRALVARRGQRGRRCHLRPVSSVIATGVGLAFAVGQGDQVALGAGTLVWHAAGAVRALLAAAGTGIGSLVRSQLAGVIGGLCVGSRRRVRYRRPVHLGQALPPLHGGHDDGGRSARRGRFRAGL